MWYGIVFMDGDEGREVVDTLEHVEGCVAHGADAESIAAAVEYLSQWDFGDESEHSPYDIAPWGNGDRTAEHGGYVLAWNLGLGYVSLNRAAEVSA